MSTPPVDVKHLKRQTYNVKISNEFLIIITIRDSFGPLLPGDVVVGHGDKRSDEIGSRYDRWVVSFMGKKKESKNDRSENKHIMDTSPTKGSTAKKLLFTVGSFLL